MQFSCAQLIGRNNHRPSLPLANYEFTHNIKTADIRLVSSVMGMLHTHPISLFQLFKKKECETHWNGNKSLGLIQLTHGWKSCVVSIISRTLPFSSGTYTSTFVNARHSLARSTCCGEEACDETSNRRSIVKSSFLLNNSCLFICHVTSAAHAWLNKSDLVWME
jgi:hypothetical protein